MLKCDLVCDIIRDLGKVCVSSLIGEGSGKKERRDGKGRGMNGKKSAFAFASRIVM